MKKILLIILIFVSMGAFNKGCYSQENPYLWDFGSVKVGTVLEHTFFIKNNLQKPLIINDLRSSCSCVVTEISTRDILSGKAGQVKVTFNTKDYNGDVTQYVYAQTSNSLDPVIKLTFKAKVLTE